VFPAIIRTMTVTPKSVRFARLPSAALAALAEGDLAGASSAAGVPLTSYFTTPDAVWLWQLRIEDIAANPQNAEWIARAAVAEPANVVVGHAGFHGPPDAAGMVEIGYSVDPAYRRQGYATAMLRELLARAAGEPDIKTVRATISPYNTASLATIAGFGFTGNGVQWDDEDGLELIFERAT
jgi:[ribosomal protein S5]-alanine N-acetyltransferase